MSLESQKQRMAWKAKLNVGYYLHKLFNLISFHVSLYLLLSAEYILYLAYS